ncbi:hypothetical protein [Sulfurospirillum halorespirans]|uniref:hypothetical protein n=1 Tax=Sulfurospirillum halorespirans TaxID=194424 RepID=UPI0011A74A8B|nr:hypothetical protein [Sulfurospirillum halorespirans]
MKHLKSKQINKSKLGILQILWKSSLIIGLSACSSPANKEDTAITKGEKIMLNELYEVKTISGQAVMTEKIVLKYFFIGMHKQDVLARLRDMGLKYAEEGKEDAITVLHQSKPAYTPGSKTLEIEFYFNNDELMRIFSRVYNTI